MFKLFSAFMLISPQAFADAPMAMPPGPSWHQFILIGVLLVSFYLIIVRPQNNRIKEQRELLNNLSVSDEVVTSGGLAGIIREINDNFLVVEIAANTMVHVQKQAVTTSLPRDTLKIKKHS